MLKILIADDNRLIRQSLRKRIDWKSLDMCCVGEAENGYQALELIRTAQPDIVIIDIRMPGMDGLQVMQYAREHGLSIQFILISGYDDFAYLKQAIRLQAVNYLLKPIHTPELIESLHWAANRFSQTALPHTDSMQQAQPVSPQKRWSAFPSLHKLNSADIAALSEYLFAICINCPTGAGSPIFPQPILEQIERQMHTLFYPANCHTHLYGRETCMVIVEQSDPQSPSDYLLEQTQKIVRTLLSAPSVYFSCSDVFERTGIHRAAKQAFFRMLERFTATDVQHWIGSQATFLSASKQRKLRQKLDELVRLQLFDACRITVQQYFADAAAQGWYSSCVLLLLNFWQDCLTDRGTALPFPSGEPAVYALQFVNQADLEHTVLCSFEQLFPAQAQHPTYEKIHAYIELFYAEPLTLQQLSKIFHLNQAYLGQLIKKSSGLSFHALLNQIRLDKAVQILMENPTVPIKDLAISLGFSDAYYFTRVFKQHFGKPPREYRASASDTSHNEL